MKLLNIVLALTLAGLPAVAAANKHENLKRGNAKSIFVVNEDEGFFNSFSKPMTNLDDHYLVGESNKSLSYSNSKDNKQFSMESFQSKFASESKLSNDFSWFNGREFLTNTNFNFFLQAANNHSPFVIIVILGDGFKSLGWSSHHDWSNHHDWDDHNGHAPVPEPTTYALMLVGLLGLGFATRRKN